MSLPLSESVTEDGAAPCDPSNSFRILFLGENWLGSNARSSFEGLRRLGCDALDVDSQSFFPILKSFSSRAALRLFRSSLVREYNQHILNLAQQFRPEILLAFKGNYVQPETLRDLRAQGITLYNYYPDTSAFAHGKWLPASLPEYDCVFYTKKFWLKDVSQRLKIREASFLPHGYDPLLHRSVELTTLDQKDYARDVSFIATHTAYKEELITKLLRLRPNLNLSIWGSGWSQRSSKELVNYVKGFHLLGEGFVRAIQSAHINLAIMSGRVKGASQGDETTSRTYIIPACGGFMLHERNAEVLELYEEGKEIACFDSPEELADKIDYFLAHPEERTAIAKAGHARCVPAYSYDNRMADILRWHRERNPQKAADATPHR
jgi:spore maturation protein CgeB